MVYQGHVENGVIVLDDSVCLPEGAEVEVSLREVESTNSNPQRSDRSIDEEIAEIVAAVPAEEWEQLPDDLSDQLDHYIYGIPKR